MHSNGGDARLFEPLTRLERADALRIPPDADFRRHRSVPAHGEDNGARGFLQKGQILQQGRPAVAAYHLGYGTAGVEIDEIRADLIHDDAGGLAQSAGGGAEELHPDRTAALFKRDVSAIASPRLQHPLGRDKFRDGHIRAKLPAKGAEDEPRHPRHGRQIKRKATVLEPERIHAAKAGTRGLPCSPGLKAS